MTRSFFAICLFGVLVMTSVGPVQAGEEKVLVYEQSVFTGAREAGDTAYEIRAVDHSRRISLEMDARKEVIRVNFIPSLTGIPEEIQVWLNAVLEHGGEIRVRETRPNEFLLDMLVIIVRELIPFLAEKALAWFDDTLSDPAENYNSVVVVRSLSAEVICYEAVEFYLKNSDAWDQVTRLSKPVPTDQARELVNVGPSGAC